LEIDVEDYIFLKVCPAKGIIRFAMVGKLSTRYIGPYCITQRVGGVAYRLELAPEPRTHNVFHVSQLCKYIQDPSDVIEPDPI